MMTFEYSCKSTSMPINRLKINELVELNRELQSLSDNIKKRYDKWVYISCSNTVSLSVVSFEIRSDSVDMLEISKNELLKYISSIYIK